jgi:hypothetical protein
VITTIDIKNKPDVLAFIIAKLTRIGWKIEPNAMLGNVMWSNLPNCTPQFLSLSYQHKSMSWVGSEGQVTAYNMLADVIETMEEARQLMEFVELNGDSFVEPTEGSSETGYNLKMYANSGKLYNYYGGNPEYYATIKVDGGLLPKDNHIIVSKQDNAKKASISPEDMQKSMELAKKADTVVGLKVKPPTPLKDVVWDVDAMDAKLGALFSAKAEAIFKKAQEDAYDKQYQKHVNKLHDDYYMKYLDKAMNDMYDTYYHKSMVNWYNVPKTNPCGEHPMSVGGEL